MTVELHLLRPLWLLALIPLGLLLWRLVHRGEGGDAWRGVVDEHLLSHLLEDDGVRVRRLPLLLLTLGWLLGVVALAGPVWERLPQPVYQTEARRVIVLDISPSMNATDLPPTRLARARFEVLDLLARSGEGQTALLAYGAEPFLVSPLTTDAETIAAQVPNLDSTLLPLQGDRRADLALEQAGELLRQAGAGEGDVILISGGLDRSAAALEAARRLSDEGYVVSVLGVGTVQGAPVPLEGGGFKKDEQGAILLPRLEVAELAALADAGGGRYLTAGTGDEDTVALIPDAGGGIQQRAAERDVDVDRWREEGPWLLLVLLPLAAVGFRRGWLSPLVLVVLLVPHPPAQALAWQELWQDLWLRPDQQAARSFATGEHQQAAERFRRPDWRAAAHYEAGDYESALQDLQGLQHGEAAYNRGNALARAGRLEDAIAEYEQVLDKDPGHEDARHNLDLLHQLLQQQPPPQQNQNQTSADNTGAEQPQDGEQDQNEQGESGDQAGAGDNQRQDQPQQEGEGGAKPESGDEPGQTSGSDQEPSEDRGDQAEGADLPEHEGERAEFNPGAASESRQQQGQGSDQRDAPSADQEHRDQAGETRSYPNAGDEPGLDDLLGGEPGRDPQAAASAPQDLAGGEDRQAMEHMLRRVPDDPGGLLRQRFLLQHLRRSGRLP